MYPSLAAAARRLRARQAVVDGEIVAMDEQGRPSFQALQHRGTHSKHRIVFYAFDLLHFDGESLVEEQLSERRARLPALLEGSGLLLSKDLPGKLPNIVHLPDIVHTIRRMGLEGVIAKRRDSPYVQDKRSPIGSS